MHVKTDKELYPIGYVARMFDVSVATLRLYEAEGLLIPHKSKGNHRLYSESDIKRIRCIRRMIDQEGINLAGIRMMLSAIPCWELKPCSLEDRANCDAFNTAAKPCWLVEVKGEICSTADCHSCNVYEQSSECTDIKNILNTYWRVRKND
ncbi:MAG: MerR family transcriptional regulator [Calditrichae bacterium]|nr:MerR family transcriptional regulator [Calditrichota bacterium]MCB9059332.1 MerR family transcriptional regulator [Calditrichia bacterium]